MKQKQLIYCMGLSAIALLASCSEREFDLDPSNGSKEQGTLVLNLNASAEFDQTRALNENDYKNTQNYDIKVINTATENVILECKASQLSSNFPKKVEMGSYRVEASYGVERDASRTEFYMYGDATATVKSKEEKVITVNCAPTCGKVSVAWDPEINTYFSDYSVSFGGTKKLGTKTFGWSKTDTEPWYIALDKNAETVTYTISLTVKDEYIVNGYSTKDGTATGTFTLERNKAHKLTIAPNYIPTTTGGMKLTITIDESTNDKEITWEVPVTWI